MKKNSLFLLVVVLFVSCHKDDVEPQQQPNNETPRQIFTLNIDPAYTASSSGQWVLIHDKDGHLIDHKTFKSGDVVTFETTKETPGDKIVVSIIYEVTDPPNHVLVTYGDVDVGTTWSLKNPVDPQYTTYPKGLPSLGIFSVTLSDAPANAKPYLSDSRGVFAGFTNPGDTYIYTPIYTANDKFMLTVAAPNAEPRYAFIESPKDQDSYKISYNDLKTFDDVVTVNFPQTNLHYEILTGYLTDHFVEREGYKIMSANSGYGATCTSLSLGFLDQFPAYTTTLSVTCGKSNYQYNHRGPRPTVIKFPVDAKYTFTNTTPQNLAYTYDQSYDFVYFTFRLKNPGTNSVVADWYVYAKDHFQPILELPSDIVSGYNISDLSKFTYLSASFVQGHDYAAILNEVFKGAARRDAYQDVYHTISAQ